MGNQERPADLDLNPSTNNGAVKDLGPVKSHSDSPALMIKLRPIRFVVYILSLCAAIVAFTVVATRGVVVRTVYDPVGTSKKADDETDKLNTWSGFLLAFIEVLVGEQMAVFMPVLDVYLHNVVWKKTANWSSRRKFASMLRVMVLFLFPLIIALTLGNSLRSLQASNSTVGFNSIVNEYDLCDEPRQGLKATGGSSGAVYDTILMNAIRQRTIPFTFAADSPCTQNNGSQLSNGERSIPLNVHDLDTSSVVYGFTLRDWNAEALTQALTPFSSVTITYSDAVNDRITSVSEETLDSAITTFLFGKVMVEKAVGDASNESNNCSLSDGRYDLDDTGSGSESSSSGSGNSRSGSSGSGSFSSGSGSGGRRRLDSNGDTSSDDTEFTQEVDDSYDEWTYENGTRICQGPVSSLFKLLDYLSESNTTANTLMTAITAGLDMSFPGTFALEETTIKLETFNITPQITLESLEIDMVIDKGIEYGLTECELEADNGTCLSSKYEYDWLANAFCGSSGCAFYDISNTFTLQKEIGLLPGLSCSEIRYSGDYRGFFPVNCEVVPNQAFLYGIGSHITGDEFGANNGTVDGPYIINARRHVTFTFGFMSWTLDDLATTFDAECGATGECSGLWYKLESSRYLFAGQSSLPARRIKNADFHSPIQLVQLNYPSAYLPKYELQIDFERLSASDFTRTRWDAKKGEKLAGDNCSMLIESFLNHVNENNFFVDHPMQPMYTAAFYFLMQDAGVTDLTSSNGKHPDELGVAALKGDQQLRAIKIIMPTTSYVVSVGGCGLLVFAMIVIVSLPRRYCAQAFADESFAAERYLAMRKDEEYPDKLYRKLVTTSNGERIPTSQLHVTSMTLVRPGQTSDKEKTTARIQL